MSAKLARKGDFFSSGTRQGTACSSITLDSYRPMPLVEARRKDKTLDSCAKFVEKLAGKQMRKEIRVAVLPPAFWALPSGWQHKNQTIRFNCFDTSECAVHEIVHAQLDHAGKNGFVKGAYHEGLAVFAENIFNGSTRYFWILLSFNFKYIPFARSLDRLSKVLGDPAEAFQMAAVKAPGTFWQMIFPLKLYAKEIAAAKAAKADAPAN
ncbi:MAG: hypothetical protein WC861_02455 [Candidatus Micrarchaeia archaeon]